MLWKSVSERSFLTKCGHLILNIKKHSIIVQSFKHYIYLKANFNFLILLINNKKGRISTIVDGFKHGTVQRGFISLDGLTEHEIDGRKLLNEDYLQKVLVEPEGYVGEPNRGMITENNADDIDGQV